MSKKSLSILEETKAVLESRSKSYLSYGEERKRVAEMVSSLHGIKITGSMITDVLICTKLVRRVRREKPDKDDYADLIGYAAKAYEADFEDGND